MTKQPPEMAPAKVASPGESALKAEPSLHMAKAWDLRTNPPTNSVKGHLVPNFLSRARRRLSVEVYRYHDPNGGHYDECFIRMLIPITKEQKRESRRLGRQARRRTGDASANGSTVNDDAASLLDGASILADDGELSVMPSYEGWEAKYKFPLSAIQIKGVHKNVLSGTFSYRQISQFREFRFDSDEDALDCANFIESQQQLEEYRHQQKFVRNSAGIKVTPSESLSLLVEIVGATDLPAGDLTTSDPYVMCYFNHVLVHKTKYIPKTLDPIWSVKTKGLFLLETTAKELFQGDGLHLEVMDFDALGNNERLGQASIDARSMFQCKGKRIKLPLEGKGAKGILSIRVRRATLYDKNFMKEYQMTDMTKAYSETDDTMKAVLSKKGGISAIQSVLSRNVKTEKHAIGPPVKKYRVRPGPDPQREEDTTWMTMEQMEREVLGESREWIDAGSGTLGRLFVEVLSCTGLPNLDTGGFTGNFTDAFACLIFEDVWSQTDIIDDDLNPKWMPWTKRAFIFHMFHPSSQLFIGIFDHDAVHNHDLIGRVAVNVSNLQPDTLYTLTYELYPSGKWNVRDPKGKVTIRLRMEIDDDRKLLLAALEPPKTIYVNVMKKADFNVLHATCNGMYDMDTYNLTTFFTYIEELQSYQGCAMYVKEAATALLLWRGHHSLVIGGKTFLLPAHSMFALASSVLIVEYPQLIPAFYFLAIAWLLTATMMFRREHPNAWHRCKSFADMFFAIVWGDSFPPAQIAPKQNEKAILEYEQVWQKKMELELKATEEAKVVAAEDADEAERVAEIIGDADNDISTKRKVAFPVKVDLLKPYLEPFQAYLAVACRLLRYVRNVILWEECYLSFWVTLGCLVLSLLSLFIPWFFVIKWTSRLLVWTIFGPWMKLVDIYYWTPMENMTDEEIANRKMKTKLLKQKYMAEAIEKARIERERAVKLKSMKQFLFGKFIMKVPVLKEDRWTDMPLPESSAVPYAPKRLALAELAMKEAGYHRIRVPGQHLEGDMIPSLETHTFTEAPIGQATKEHAQPESDSAAYVKVGSLVAGAAFITYFGIPVASSVLSSLFSV